MYIHNLVTITLLSIPNDFSPVEHNKRGYEQTASVAISVHILKVNVTLLPSFELHRRESYRFTRT